MAAAYRPLLELNEDGEPLSALLCAAFAAADDEFGRGRFHGLGEPRGDPLPITPIATALEEEEEGAGVGESGAPADRKPEPVAAAELTLDREDGRTIGSESVATPKKRLVGVFGPVLVRPRVGVPGLLEPGEGGILFGPGKPPVTLLPEPKLEPKREGVQGLAIAAFEAERSGGGLRLEVGDSSVLWELSS